MLTYDQALKDLQDYSNTIFKQRAEIERLRAALNQRDEFLRDTDNWPEFVESLHRNSKTVIEQLKVCPMCGLKLYDGKICRSCDYGCER